MTDHSCPACGGEGRYSGLGVLGSLYWLRCRACGMEYFVRIKILQDKKAPA